MFGRGPLRPPQGEATAPATAPAVRIGRQAVFDAQRSLVGYQLHVRAAPGAATEGAGDVASAQVLGAAVGEVGRPTPGGGLPVFVTLTRAFVVGELPVMVSPESVVLVIGPDVGADPQVVAGLERLRGAGYRTAVTDLDGDPARLALLPLADVVGVVVGSRDRTAVRAAMMLARTAAPGAQLLAEQVDDADALDLSLAADLLLGTALERPSTLAAPVVDASQATALRLVAALADPDVSVAEIERLVLADVALSTKVLRAAGSSAVAPSAPISSVHQAIVLLGPRVLGAWTSLIALGSGASSAQRQSSLTFVLARAGACSRLAAGSPHVAHTVGLLSGMAEALRVPVTELMASVRLHDDVESALTQFEGPAGEALAAVLQTEHGPDPDRLTGIPGLSAPHPHGQRAAMAYLDALGEAMALSASLGA